MPEFREHISCQELVELTSDYIENALSAEDAELLEQHLNYCAGCEQYVDEMLRTIRAERMLREEGAPDETLAPIISTFRERRQS